MKAKPSKSPARSKGLTTETIFHAAVESAPNGVLITDTHGRIVLVNRQVEQMFGYDRAELIGQSIEMLVPTPMRAAHTEQRHTFHGNPHARAMGMGRDLTALRKDGVEIPVEIGLTQMETPDGKFVLASLVDITARKLTEDALRASEARYRLLFESNPQPMWVIDAATYRFLAVNPAAVQHYGYSSEEFLSMTALDIRPHAEEGRFLQAMASPRDGVRHTDGWRHRKKNGDLIDVEIGTHTIVFGDTQAVLALITDVTERSRSEAALQESEERFRQIAEHIQEVFFLMEIPTGRVLYLNPTFEKAWGLPVKDVYEHPDRWMNGIHPDDRTIVAEGLAKALARQTTTTVFRIVRPDGSMRWARARGFPVTGAKRLVGLVEDITDLKRAEEQATQAQKMEAIGRLAGGVAHDFNNLLTVILGEVELLQMEPPSPDEVVIALGDIRSAAERAANLTRQLLAFSRRQLLEPTIFKMNDLVTDMGKMMQRLVGEHVKLTIHVAPDPGSVKADRGQIEQVLANLVVNARDAMPQGGAIGIETQSVSLDADYQREHPYAMPGDYVMLAVSDTGTGMTPEVKARIFEPFFTTKELGKGTGLGLATSYGIVKQVGGHITVYSEVGKGTTLKVYLPRVTTGTTGEFTVVVPPARGSESVLLVEDDKPVREVAARVLRSQGYTVLVAESGKEAWRIAESDAPIDLLLSDVVLPGMGGREIAERVTELRPGIKVLFATGYTDDVVLQNRLLANDVNLIQKPFTREALARKVREVLDERG